MEQLVILASEAPRFTSTWVVVDFVPDPRCRVEAVPIQCIVVLKSRECYSQTFKGVVRRGDSVA
ncbi:hypothetical protein TorRG33x02_333580 [Trema orientale]|uniref:Uncharacterized protein n=1 Tax=Trema orientale TaxID=63057 RepID=A0A2P5B3X3_TREOI|nr:hypothetical protein TorRG33x02_333580 [Trema orientale]